MKSLNLSGKITTEWVTPEMAVNWLKQHNTRNRNVSRKRAKAIARDIKGGRFEDRGDFIKFDFDGILLDGQHRLLAVAIAGVPCCMRIIRGLQPGTRCDDVRMRSYADNARIAGDSNTRSLSAVLSIVCRYAGNHDPVEIITQPEKECARDAFPEVVESVGWCTSNLPSRMKGAAFCALHLLLGVEDAKKRDEIFNWLKTGAGMEIGNPVLTFRNRIMNASDREWFAMRSNACGIFNTFAAAHRSLCDGTSLSKIPFRDQDRYLVELRGVSRMKVLERISAPGTDDCDVDGAFDIVMAALAS